MGEQHMLMAVITASIMLVAVKDVILFTTPGESTALLEDLLDQKARDTLLVLNDIPAGKDAPCGVRTRLEEHVHAGLRGETGAWDAWASQRIPPGIEAELLFSNRDGSMHLQGDTVWNASTASISYQPDQSYSLPLTNVDSVSGTQSLLVSAPLVAWASHARMKGDALRIEAQVEGLVDDELVRPEGILQSTPVVHAPIALLDDTLDARAREGGGNILWVVQGAKRLHVAAEAPNVRVAAPSAMSLRLIVDSLPVPEGAPGVIPVGTTLTVEFPRGWRSAGFTGAMGSWVNVTDPADPLRLRAVVQGAPATSRELEISALPPPEPAHPFDLVKASLGHGSLGESTLVVTYPVPGTERALPRTLHPTHAYPVRLGSWTTLGAALANGGDAVVVTEMKFRVLPDYDHARNGGLGAPLFTGELVPIAPATGTWSMEEGGRVLVWRGEGVIVQPGKADDWLVSVRVTSDPSHATSVERPDSDGPNATFVFDNGYKASSRSWGKVPGVPVVRVPPATRPVDHPEGGTSDGYPWSASVAGEIHTVSVVSRSALATIENTTKYRTRLASPALADLDTALANATFEVTTRAPRVGSTVHATGDFSNAMTLLAEAGLTATIGLDLFTPESLGCEPTLSWELSGASLPSAATNAVLPSSVGGVVSMFAATSDGYVHRLDAAGTPIWSQRAAGEPVALLVVDSPSWGAHVFVGTKTGKLQRLDPHLGTTVWTEIVGGVGGSVSASVDVLAFDESRGWILAANEAGEVEAHSLGGVMQRMARVGLSPLDIVATGQHVFVLDARMLHRLDEKLENDTVYPVDALGFVLTPSEVWLATKLDVRRVERASLRELGKEDLPTEAALVTRGDATGDGVEDLVVAQADSRVRIFPGTSFSDVRVFTPENLITWSEDEPLPDDLALVGRGEADVPRYCFPGTPFAHYARTVTCRGNVGTGPVLVSAAQGSVALLYATVINVFLEQFDAQGQVIQGGAIVDGTTTPTALHVGPWALSPRAVGYGDSHGLVAAYTSETSMESWPGGRIGTFAFAMNIPEGGLYGTNILVARLTWGAGPGREEARLVDHFEVLDASGSEQANPVYRVSLALKDMSRR